MLIPDPRRTPLPNLISHNGIILYQWEFLRARLDEGEGLPWIAMDILINFFVMLRHASCASLRPVVQPSSPASPFIRIHIIQNLRDEAFHDTAF